MNKITNMYSNAGYKLKDQIITETEQGIYFSSYGTVIAFKPFSGRIQLSSAYMASTVTGKYRNKFLGEKLPATKYKLETGEYILVDKILIK